MLTAAFAALLSTAVMGSGTAANDPYYVAGGHPACSDTGPGSVVTPWCSIDKAGSAPAGATVLVRSGTYGELVVRGRTDLTVRAFPAESPLLAGVGIEEHSTRVTVSGFTIRANAPDVAEVYVKQSADILLDHLHLDRALFRSRATSGLVIQNSLVENGPSDSEATSQGLFCGCGIDARGFMDVPTSNITIRRNRFLNLAADGLHLNDVVGSLVEGNYFHMTQPWRAENHVDTIQALKGADHVIRNNEAYGWIHGILTTDDAPQDGPDADNRAMVVQNNLIVTDRHYAFNGAPGPNSLIVNNTWSGSDDGISKGVIVRWTVGSNPGTTTSAGAVFANNVVDGTCADCDDTRMTFKSNVTRSNFEFAAGYELPAGSPAIDTADPAYAPPTDLRCRARNGPPDVGALEYGGIPPEIPTPTSCVPECEPVCDDQIGGQKAIDPTRACRRVVPALGKVRRALRADLKTASKALRRLGIDGLLKRRRFAIRGFDALTAGTLRVTLTARTAKATRAAARKRMLAKARRSFAQPGKYRVSVKLTRKGKRILRRSRRRTATLALAFRECPGRAVRRSKKVKLRR